MIDITFTTEWWDEQSIYLGWFESYIWEDHNYEWHEEEEEATIDICYVYRLGRTKGHWCWYLMNI